MKSHDLFMGDGHPEDPQLWDYNLTTDEVVQRVSTQIREGELGGDEITIVVRTTEKEDQ